MAAVEEDRDTDEAPAGGACCRPDGGPADNGRALRRGLADDRGLASDRNGGRRAGGGWRKSSEA